MKIIVKTERSNRDVAVLEGITSSSTIESLKLALYNLKKKDSKYQDCRVRFSIDRVQLEDKKTVSDYSLKDGDTILYKDLGPQIGWSTVFVCEYFGPLLIYPIFYFFSDFIYGGSFAKSPVQTLALICYSAHYIKRILETIFVHRFSHQTMPLRNLFKNCGYYWGCTVMVSYFVNHALFTPTNEFRQYLGLALFVFGELSNFYCHIILMNLRPPGSTERRIPKGFLFEFVSCPNYTFEILAWVGFSIMTQTFTSYLFTLIGGLQMLQWAGGKHRRYRKDFPNYPRSRKLLIPFLL